MWRQGAGGRGNYDQLNTSTALVDEWLVLGRIHRIVVLLGEAASEGGRASIDDGVAAS